MEEKTGGIEWVWALVEKGGEIGRFFALEDEEGRYIPVFRRQEDGYAVKPGLVKKSSGDYELQAIQKRNLLDAARQDGFAVWVLNDEGRILERIN